MTIVNFRYRPGSVQSLSPSPPGKRGEALRSSRGILGRRNDDRRLRHVETLYRQCRGVIDAFGGSIIATTPGGIIQLWSAGAERMLGYSEDQVKGKAIGFLGTSPSAFALASGSCVWQPRLRYMYLHHREGLLIRAVIRSTPMLDGDGRCHGIVWNVERDHHGSVSRP